MFTHMWGLETRLNEVAKNTSERFSQVDARLQALEQRAGEQIYLDSARKNVLSPLGA